MLFPPPNALALPMKSSVFALLQSPVVTRPGVFPLKPMAALMALPWLASNAGYK